MRRVRGGRIFLFISVCPIMVGSVSSTDSSALLHDRTLPFPSFFVVLLFFCILFNNLCIYSIQKEGDETTERSHSGVCIEQ